MNDKAQIKQTILKNLKTDIDFEIDKLIEKNWLNEKFESPNLTENHFFIEAYSDFQSLLAEKIQAISKQIIHTSKLH